MELKIISEIENALFNRKEIKAEVDASFTPSNLEVLKLLSKKYSVSEDVIKIKGIYGKFGLSKFKIEANIYSSKEEKEKIEIKTKKEIEAEKKALEEKKKLEEESKKEEEKPAESETSNESNKEEKSKEENKVEENKE